MDKIKRYVNLYIPVTTCTLRCHYCYITHHRLFGGPLPELKYSAEQVRKALSKARLGGGKSYKYLWRRRDSVAA